MGDGGTKRYAAIAPRALAERFLRQFIGEHIDRFAGFGEIACRGGRICCVMLRRDGSCIVGIGDMSDPMDRFALSKPYRQVRGLTWAGNEPLFVAWPEEDGSWPRVVHGITSRQEEKPHETIVSDDLQWVGGKPLYRVYYSKEMLLVWGTAESARYDFITRPTIDANHFEAWAVKSLRIYKITPNLGG